MSFSNILRNLSNIYGWRTAKKIIVIESDDWGSIRMPSLAAFERLKQKGLAVDKGDAGRYNRNDTLASENDFAALFETLQKIKDSNGKPAVFTPVSLVANPDFEKIRQEKFQQYFYEPFTSTLQKYYPGKNVFQYWQEGIKNKLFVPQFHGREHLNVAAWMKALQQNDEQTHAAFNEGSWGFSNKHPYNVKYQAAFDLTDPSEIKEQEKIIADGLALFEKLFGYKASFFVPPNGPFNNTLEKTAAGSGIQFMSASKVQQEALGLGKTKKRYHWIGQKNKHNQLYITRNCFFEPSQAGKNWVQSCLEEIEIAFRWKKPAVISSHRVNYIGSLNEANRKNGLQQLETLLQQALTKWSGIEFMTSAELGELIKTGK